MISRLLHIDDNYLIIQTGRYLEIYDTIYNQIIDRIFLSELTILENIDLIKRALRLGIHHLILIDKKRMLLITKKKGYLYDKDCKSMNEIFTVPHSKRPLIVLWDKKNSLYFGDYINNKERKEVKIYQYNINNNSLKIIYRFPKGSVRHIHGIFEDPYTQKIWITTGDNDAECALWETTYDFDQVIPILHGSQNYRAVQLLFSERYIYYGTDSNSEKNYIFRYDKWKYKIEKMQEIQGAVLYGCKVREWLFFSTIVEDSKINKDKYVYIWYSKDGEKWKCIHKHRKDYWHNKIFQYGQILFPSGSNNSEVLWYTPFGTKENGIIKKIYLNKLIVEKKHEHIYSK